MRLPILKDGVPFTPLATYAAVATYSAGWRQDAPPSAGKYERLTALGPVVDEWDGRWWNRVQTYSNGTNRRALIRCANQNLPWRAPIHPFAPPINFTIDELERVGHGG